MGGNSIMQYPKG